MKTRIYTGHCRHGRGIFASDLIRKDDLILRYCGPIITLEEALAKGAEAFNPIQIAPMLYLDPQEPGLLVNHSCLPNAGLRSDVYLVALRDIQHDEEITFDYSTTMSERMGSMRCECGEPTCRGIVGDFHDLPEATKEQYLKLGIVQSFIVNEHHGFASQEDAISLEPSPRPYGSPAAGSPSGQA